MKQSRHFAATALLRELCSKWTDMEIQHLFFDSRELSRQNYFQWIYSLRAAGTPEMNVQSCLYFNSGNPHIGNSPKSRFWSAWGAGQQQRIQPSNTKYKNWLLKQNRFVPIQTPYEFKLVSHNTSICCKARVTFRVFKLGRYSIVYVSLLPCFAARSHKSALGQDAERHESA